MAKLKQQRLALTIGARLLQLSIVLLCVSFVTFALIYLAPGDPAIAMYESSGINPTPEMIATARAQMGLDKSFIEQYLIWLGNCLSGDFGTSFSLHAKVLPLLCERIIPTAKLAVLALVLMLVIAVPAGVIAAIYRNRIPDIVIRGFSFFGISMPGFWLGLILLYIFALKLRLIPVISSAGSLKQMILPALTLAIAMASKYCRQVRTAFLEELNQDYVVGAISRGISQKRIICCHILPNSLLPLITLLGLSLGSLLGGTAVVEIIFSYPGLGNLAVNAVKARDYPLIQGFVLWIALIYMMINLLVDLSYGLIDPRVRAGGTK